MQNHVSPAPRRFDALGLITPFFDGLPKASVLVFLAVGSWFLAIASIAATIKVAGALVHHWPF